LKKFAFKTKILQEQKWVYDEPTPSNATIGVEIPIPVQGGLAYSDLAIID
jgi:hypothetical protein